MAPGEEIAVGVAASGAAGAGVKETLGALRSSAFFLIVFGGLHWAARKFWLGWDDPIITITSFILFLLAGYAVSVHYEKGKAVVFIPMITFLVWLLGFGGSLDVKVLAWIVGIFILISLIFGFGTKGKSLPKELHGLFPAIILFLDAGLLAWISINFQVTPSPLLESVVLWMPWWVFIGVWTLPTEGVKNKAGSAILTIVRIAGILVIASVVLIPLLGAGVETPEGPDVSLTEFQEAQRDFESRSRTGFKQSSIYLAFACISEVTDYDGCQQRLREEAEEQYICEDLEELNRGSDEYDECIAEIREQRSGNVFQVSGILDPTYDKATEAKFSVSQHFPKESFYQAGQETTLRYPTKFSLTKPRAQESQGEFGCIFTKRGDDENVTGTITPSTAIFNKEENELAVTCIPDGPLNGSYDLEYSVTLKELKTTSKLVRLYIGDKSEDWKERKLSKLQSAYFSGGQHLSQASNDPVQINFAMGSPLENPFIEGTEGLVIAASINNQGRGELVDIHNYHLGFDGFIVDNPDCLSGTLDLPDEFLQRRTIHLPACFVESLPTELENPEEFIRDEIVATLIYTYKEKHTEQIQVQEVTIS